MRSRLKYFVYLQSNLFLITSLSQRGKMFLMQFKKCVFFLFIPIIILIIGLSFNLYLHKYF